MKKEKIYTILFLLVLMWMSVTGQYLTMSEFNDDAWLYGTIDIIIISVMMMIIPLIFRLFNKERLDIKKGKSICKWNSIGMFICSSALFAGILGVEKSGGIGGIGALIYYYINKWLFVYDEDMLKQKRKLKLKKELENNYNEIMKESNEETLKIDKRKNRFCKLCGGKLDINNRCKKCGKKYFKFNKTLFLYIVIVLLIISNILFLLLYDDAKATIKNIYEVNNENTDWCESQLDSLIGDNGTYYTKEKLEFFDKNIVFVIEGYGGNYYYTYDCVQTITKGNQYSFIAFNEHSAIRQGYQKGNCY